MNLADMIFILTILVFVIMISTIYLIAKYGFAKIAPGSGVPYRISKILFATIYTFFQFLIGISVISFILIMIFKDHIGTDIALPIISAIIGYLLGRTFPVEKVFTVEKNEKNM